MLVDVWLTFFVREIVFVFDRAFWLRCDSDEEFNRLSNGVKCQQEIFKYRVKSVLFQRTGETKSSLADKFL